MHLWFDDDGTYPSGFAGGKFTNERPDLRMEGLTAHNASPLPPASNILQTRNWYHLRPGRQP